MVIKCGVCGGMMEVPDDAADGQHFKCPFCGETTAYSKPARVEVPVGADRRSAKPKIGIRRPSPTESVRRVEMEDRLRIAINPQPPRKPASAPKRVLSAAEERVALYEEGRRKAARQKMVRNFVESVTLLLALCTLVGLVLWWQSHRNKVAAEAARIEAEAEAERIRLRDEKDRQVRAQREKDRLEREAERAREAQRRKKEQEELARRRQEEREAVERAEKEIRDNKERYNLYVMALKENDFDIFVKSVTNDMDKVGGELCYLLPSTTVEMPLFHVSYETNGVKRVFKLYEDGKRDEVEFEAFQETIKDVEYLVAKRGTVYFRSTRKSPATGLLPIASESDPAETFFGSLAPVLKVLKPTYDELTFDVFFTPNGSGKKIFIENLPFGCSWSLRNVREAIEKDTPMSNGSSYSSGSRVKKFKRTVKIWNGAAIKQGIDGITYVPSSPPPERYRERYSYNLPNVIYRSRTVRYDNSYGRWQTLYNKAQQEEAEETAYYERLRQKSADRRASVQAASEQRWQKKVDGILSNGVLSYKIRKAKVKE